MVAIVPLDFIHSRSGHESFIPYPPEWVDSRALAATIAESYSVPAAARYLLFACTADFYANCFATAVVPTDLSDGSAAQLNPAGYYVSSILPDGQPMTGHAAVSSISFITAATTAILTIAVYR